VIARDPAERDPVIWVGPKHLPLLERFSLGNAGKIVKGSFISEPASHDLHPVDSHHDDGFHDRSPDHPITRDHPILQNVFSVT
jgi:hypothetical protein